MQQYYSSSTTAKAARTAPTQGPTICTAAAQQGRTSAVREFVDADVMMLHGIGVSILFPCFTVRRHIGTGDGSFRRSPLPARRVWRWRPFFRWRLRGLLCGAGVALSRGRGRSRGARESLTKSGHSKPNRKPNQMCRPKARRRS